jgi:hypothetical protein
MKQIFYSLLLLNDHMWSQSNFAIFLRMKNVSGRGSFEGIFLETNPSDTKVIEYLGEHRVNLNHGIKR